MKRSRPVSLVFVLMTYFLVIFIKMSPSIVMPTFQSDLSLTSSMVGLISGAYFFSYAFMQLAAGPLCKKFGATNVIGTGIAVAAMGLVIFGFGRNAYVLLSGRLLLGLGTGPIFVALLFFLQCNYDAKGYLRNYSIAVFVSNLGSAFSAAPLKIALRYVSIHALFSILAVMSVVAGAVLFIFGTKGESVVRDTERSFMGQISDSMREIAADSRLVGCLLVWMMVSGGILAYQGLWCTKWTASSFPGYSDLSGLSGTLVSLGIMTASLLASHIEGFCGRNGRNVIVSGWLQILALSLVVTVKTGDSKSLLVLSFISDYVFGILMGNVCLQIPPFIARISSKEGNATIMGIFNFMASLFTQAVQYGTGILVDKTKSFAQSFLMMIVFYAFVMIYVSVAISDGKKRVDNATQ